MDEKGTMHGVRKGTYLERSGASHGGSIEVAGRTFMVSLPVRTLRCLLVDRLGVLLLFAPQISAKALKRTILTVTDAPCYR